MILKDGEKIVRFIADKDEISLHVKPDFTKKVEKGIFTGVDNIIRVKLSDIEEIKEYVFGDCSNMSYFECKMNSKTVSSGSEESQISPKNLLIQYNAFKDCYELRDIVLLGYNKITIESGAFSGCNKLRSLVIDDAELDIRSDSLSDADNSKFCVFSRNEKNNALLEKYGIKTAKYAELE